MKRTLLLSAAAGGLLAAGPALAETKISTATTAPVRTATIKASAPDDVTVETAGSIKPTVSGAAITVDSDHKVKVAGETSFNNVSNATAIYVEGGRTTEVTLSGAANLLEDYTPVDTDKDGDFDGPLVQGSNRYAIRLGGPLVTGNVMVAKGGSVVIEGNQSAAILVEGTLRGNLTNSGSLAVGGTNAAGVSAARVEGNLRHDGSILVRGEGATGIRLGEATGTFVIQGGIVATGYRSELRPADTSKLDADDLQQGGSGVRVTGGLGGGLLLDAPPADLDPNKADEDADGTPDSEEKRASVSAYGAAPAIDLGGATATTIAAVAGSGGYGLVVKGDVTGAGVYDGVSATGLRIGQAGGGTTAVAGGLHLQGGSINATAVKADATGLRLNGGASLPELKSSGTIKATSTGGTGVYGATAVHVEAGADLFAIRNSGAITADAASAHATATAIRDLSGEVGLVENTGTIRGLNGAGAVGKSIAIDLSARSEGAIVRQLAPASTTAAEPSIVGDVRFGSGDDLLELKKGSVSGEVSFGAGLDRFFVDGGRFTGTLKDSDGTLAFELKAGLVDLRSTDTVQVGTLKLGAGSTLVVTASGETGAASRLVASGAATIENGAKVELRLTSVLSGPKSFHIVGAGGGLTYGGAGAGVSGAPFMYAASLRMNQAGDALFADVRLKTGAELGVERSGSQAWNEVAAALSRDDKIEAAFLSAGDRTSFQALYDQMLPDHSGGSLLTAAAVSSALSSAINQPGDLGRGGPTGVWFQQLNVDLTRDRIDAQGADARAFGFAGGIEEVDADDDAWGLAAAWVSGEHTAADGRDDDRVQSTSILGGVYGRKTFGAFRIDARAGGGLVKFDGERRLVNAAAGLNRTAGAEWDGWTADARLGAAWDGRFGRFTVRPEMSVDWIKLSEDAYAETGGGNGFDLEVGARESDLLTGTAAVAFGARFGGESGRWRPELTVGWRERLSGEVAATTARFRGGSGASFTLSPEDLPDGGLLYKLSLKGEYERALFALEAGGESGDAYSQLDVRAFVKLTF